MKPPGTRQNIFLPLRCKPVDVFVSVAVIFLANYMINVWLPHRKPIGNDLIASLLSIGIVLFGVPSILLFLIRSQRVAEMYMFPTSWKSEFKFFAIMSCIVAIIIITLVVWAVTALDSAQIDDGGDKYARSYLIWKARQLSGTSLCVFLSIVVFLIPLAEEFFWRGFIFRYLLESLSSFIAIPVQSLVFTVYHFRPAMADNIWIFVLGCVYGFVFLKRKNIFTAYVFHGFVNGIGSIFFWNSL